MRFFFGRGSLGALRALDVARATVLISQSIYENPDILAFIKKSIAGADRQFLKMPRGEPTIESLQPVVGEVQNFGPDWIIAIGGGSVIDAAKLVWVLYEFPYGDLERFKRPFALPELRGKARFAVAPTTAGTGSEVSSAAVYSDVHSAGKQMLVSHELLPDVVVLDPRLAAGVPRNVIAASGLDAISHALEGYVSLYKNAFADRQAELALRMIFNDLVPYYQDPENESACESMMQAALFAGWVQNLKVPGVGHAIAHQLSEYGIGHGFGTGALLDASIVYNRSDEAAASKYDTLAARCGFKESEGLIDAVRSIRDAVGIGESEIKAKMSHPELISFAVQHAPDDVCAKANPRKVTPEGVQELLEGVLC